MAELKHFIFRYFIRYMFVLVPFLAISTVVTQININRFSEKEKLNVEQQLKYLSEDMAEWYQSHFEKAVVLGQHELVHSRYALEDAGKASETIAFLRTLKLFDSGIRDIFVYYGEGAIFGTDGKCNPYAYFKETLHCIAEDVEKAQEIIKSGESAFILLESQNSTDYLLYHFPINGKSKNQYRAIQYVVPISYWEEQVEERFGEGVQVTLKFENNTDSVQLINNIKTKKADKNYVTIIDEVDESGIYIELLYDSRLVYRELINFQRSNICLLLLGVVFSATISLKMSRQGGRKIERILNQMQGKKMPIAENRLLSDNFDYVQNLFEVLLKENQYIKSEKSDRQKIILKQFSRLLFHGLLQDNSSITHVFKAAGYELFEEYYCLFGVGFEGEADAKEYAEKTGKIIYDYLPEGDSNAIIFLEEIPAKDPTGKIRNNKAQRILSEAAELGLAVKRVVSSQIYQDLSLANQGYLEAVSLMEYSGKSEKIYLCWEYFAWDSVSKVVQLPKELKEEFADAIEEQNLQKCKESLGRIKLFIRNVPQSADNQRYLRYCILHELMIGMRREESKENARLLERVMQLDPSENDKFYEQVEYLLCRLCTPDSAEIQFAKIVAYIEENYMRYDLSLEEIAEYAGISKVQMSKIFKKHMGARYIDYLTQLRMERACWLLRETTTPIKDILQQVGYVDKASFSKKFKEYYGMNASDYRKQAQENKTQLKE